MTPNPLLTLCGMPELAADGTLGLPDGLGIGLDLAPQQLEPWMTGHWHLTRD